MDAFLILTRQPRLRELADWLGENAASCVVVTRKTSAGAAELDALFRHVEYLPSYDDDAAGRLIADLALRFRVQRIASLNEVDVLRAAAVRELLGLPGQDMACAIAFRDKYVMKSLASAAGIGVAGMRRLPASLEPGGPEAAALTYPAVVKPVAGGGSVGVRLLKSADDWDSLAAARGPLLLEDWIDEAAFFIVDGLMLDGHVQQRVILRMLSGNLSYLTQHMPVAGCSLAESSELSERITEFASRVLSALPPVSVETAFHLELFQDHRGELVLCEVASRPGGMGHPYTFAAVTGIDLAAASLLGQLGLTDARPSPVRRLREAAFVYYPKRAGTLVRHPERLEHPNVAFFSAMARSGDTVERAGWVGDSVAKIHVAAPVGDDIGQLMAAVIKDYESGTEWAN